MFSYTRKVLTLSVTKDTNISAVNVSVNGTNVTSANGEYSVKDGSSVVITSTAKNGYTVSTITVNQTA